MSTDAPNEGLPDAWTVWNDGRDRLILAFRPDVFDGDAFPAACLPTLVVTDVHSRRPGAQSTGRWRVELLAEPDVTVAERGPFDSRDAAETVAVDLADAFAAGGIDYRAAYQVPRPDYLDRLDALVGATDP